jgi:glycerophosphoryl diester phosphodiesterase
MPTTKMRTRQIAIATTLILVAANWLGHSAETSSPAETLINLSRPLVIGHRGYNQIAPENTLPSFKLAKAAGADMVELDYSHTKDGRLVVIHDEVLDRTTDAVARWGEKGVPIKRKTSDELCSLDAGKWFDQKNAGSHLPTYAGTHLPTLAESLDLIQDGNLTLIHHKEGDAATCLKLLREKNLINKVIVQSFDWSYLKDFHQQAPQQMLGALGPLESRGGKQLTDAEKVLDSLWVDEVRNTGARVVVWNSQITRAAVDYAHRQGMKVWVYTVNDPAVANKMLDLGADGMITDNTSILWRTLALRNVFPSASPHTSKPE